MENPRNISAIWITRAKFSCWFKWGQLFGCLLLFSLFRCMTNLTQHFQAFSLFLFSPLLLSFLLLKKWASNSFTSWLLYTSEIYDLPIYHLSIYHHHHLSVYICHLPFHSSISSMENLDECMYVHAYTCIYVYVCILLMLFCQTILNKFSKLGCLNFTWRWDYLIFIT